MLDSFGYGIDWTHLNGLVLEEHLKGGIWDSSTGKARDASEVIMSVSPPDKTAKAMEIWKKEAL